MTNSQSIKTTLLLAATQLKVQGIDADTAKLEAQLLLQHTLNVNRAWLISHENHALQVNIHAAYRAMLERRLNGEPIAYILGYREFYGLSLKVSADTLIPRADTEALVEAALARIAFSSAPSPQPSPSGGEGVISAQVLAASSPSPQPLSHEGARGLNSQRESPLPLWERARERGESHDTSSSPSFPRKRESMLTLNQKMDSRLRENDEVENKSFEEKPYVALKSLDSDFRRNDEFRVLDLGTGTGAIALAIANHRPQAHVTALDASQASLDIAIENAQNLNITNVKFVLSDWFSALNGEKFDVIVSNPPYIEAADAHLNQGDLRFEPLSALASGADGLDAIRTIIAQAPQHLHPHGYLLLEHGYNQAEKVASLLKQAGFTEISHTKDLAGINRVTLGRL